MGIEGGEEEGRIAYVCRRSSLNEGGKRMEGRVQHLSEQEEGEKGKL